MSGIAPMSLRQIAQALGGEVSGGQVLAPAPGHSPKDRGLSVRLETGALVSSFIYLTAAIR
jgi:hypothetical protein